MSIRIPLKDTESLLFRVKKFEYNSYRIDHTIVKGILRVANIPTDILRIPDDQFPASADIQEEQKHVVLYQSIVSFTNRGDKQEPSNPQPQKNDFDNSKRKELTNYLQDEQTFEPWNEYVIQGENPKLLRARTVLSKAVWYPDFINKIGDPYIWAYHNTTLSVSDDPTPEIGMK